MVVIEPPELKPCLRAYIAWSAWRRRSSGDRLPSSSTTPTLAETVFGAMIGHGSCEDGPDPLDEPARLRRVTRRPHEDDELVTTESGDEVLGAYDLPEPRRDLDEHGVADVVAERIVDVLEVVEIDERDDRGLVRGAGAFERVGEGGAVQQLRERIRRHLVHEEPFALPYLLFDRIAAANVPLTTHRTAASKASAAAAIMWDPPWLTIVGAMPSSTAISPPRMPAKHQTNTMRQSMPRSWARSCTARRRVRDAEQSSPSAGVENRGRAGRCEHDAGLLAHTGVGTTAVPDAARDVERDRRQHHDHEDPVGRSHDQVVPAQCPDRGDRGDARDVPTGHHGEERGPGRSRHARARDSSTFTLDTPPVRHTGGPDLPGPASGLYASNPPSGPGPEMACGGPPDRTPSRR